MEFPIFDKRSLRVSDFPEDDVQNLEAAVTHIHPAVGRSAVFLVGVNDSRGEHPLLDPITRVAPTVSQVLSRTMENVFVNRFAATILLMKT